MSEAQAAVALITVEDDPHVLLVRRADDPRDPWAGHWAFPGGRREDGETILETCIRECAEECGLDLTAADLVEALPISMAGRSMNKPIAVAPFHWHLPERPAIILEPKELQSASYLRLHTFSHWNRHGSGRLAPAYPDREYPYYEHEGVPLWGFTYQVLRQWLVNK